MTKPVLRKLSPRKKQSIKNVALERRRITDENGRTQTIYRLDASSGHFDLQFSKAFSLSVAKARKENKRLTGSADVGRRKK